MKNVHEKFESFFSAKEKLVDTVELDKQFNMGVVARLSGVCMKAITDSSSSSSKKDESRDRIIAEIKSAEKRVAASCTHEPFTKFEWKHELPVCLAEQVDAIIQQKKSK